MILSYKVDPRTKLIMVIILSSLSIAFSELSLLGILLILSTFFTIIMKGDLIGILFRLKKLIILMLMIVIIQSIFNQTGMVLFQVGPVVLIRENGLIKAIAFFLRLSILIVSASILTTSSSREIIQGLVQWKCPYEIAFMVLVGIRFLPIFKEELTDLVIAIQLRGIDLNKVKLSQKINVYRYILLPVITNALLKARELSAAMEMRGFRAYPTRSSYLELKMQWLDYIMVTVSISLLIIIIVMR